MDIVGEVTYRVIDYAGQLCLEASPQDSRYEIDGRPPILRIPIADAGPEAVAKAKEAVPEGLEMLLGEGVH
jgi:hypothetical protein